MIVLATATEKRKVTFFNIMKTQLAKLGILVERHTYVSITPDDLSPEEHSKFVRLDIDPNSVTWNRVLAVSIITHQTYGK